MLGQIGFRCQIFSIVILPKSVCYNGPEESRFQPAAWNWLLDPIYLRYAYGGLLLNKTCEIIMIHLMRALNCFVNNGVRLIFGFKLGNSN